MISLLRVARGEDPEQSCKTFWIQNQCSDKVLQWIHDLKNKGIIWFGKGRNHDRDCLLSMLKIYSVFFRQGYYCLERTTKG